MAAPTTYATIAGHRVSLTPCDSGRLVSVQTATANVGLYSIQRFGADPLTPSGRLTAKAVRAFAAYLTEKPSGK